MRLGIDASNISTGGGRTHILSFLRYLDPADVGFDTVIIWCSESLAAKIEGRPWLQIESFGALDRGLVARSIFRFGWLKKALAKSDCDVIFYPGGTVLTSVKPAVTMFRNMLPFDRAERKRFGLSLFRLKLEVLRHVQIRSFGVANGLICLNRFAQCEIEKELPTFRGALISIPHGVDDRFRSSSDHRRAAGSFSDRSQCCIAYVSSIELYKHQWHLVEAVSMLRLEGRHCRVDFVGTSEKRARALLDASVHRFDPSGEFVRILGPVEWDLLPRFYRSVDILVFASTCENMPNILLEYMASGVPIVCVNKSPMIDIASGCAFFFKPEDPVDLARALRAAMDSYEQAAINSERARFVSDHYSWSLCSSLTGKFLAKVAKETKRSRSV